MANALVALHAQGPDFANAFNKGAEAAQGRQMNALRMQGAKEEMGRKQAEFLMQTLGSIGMGVMGGDPNGTPDPERWEQGLDYLDSLGLGLETAPYRGKPQLAPVLVNSALSAWQHIQKASDDRDFEQTLREFEFRMQDANRKYDLELMKAAGDSALKPQSPLGKLAADYQAGLISDEEYQAAVAKATQSSGGITVAPDGTVTIGGPSDKEFDKKIAAEDAKLLTEARQSAATAQELGALAEQMETIMPDVGYTGPGGDIYGKVDDVIGVLPGDKGARGAFRQLSMEAQLAMTQKTKGAITDREMGMFRAAVPGLIQTPEGNRAMAQIMKATAQRQADRATFLEQYRAEKGSLLGASHAWDLYIKENPLIGKTEEGALGLLAPKKAMSAYISGDRSEVTAKSFKIPEGVTDEDIEYTMRLHGLTREQVLEQLNAP